MRISLIHLECINFQGSSEAAKLTFRTDRTLERKLNPTSSHLTGSAAAAQTVCMAAVFQLARYTI